MQITSRLRLVAAGVLSILLAPAAFAQEPAADRVVASVGDYSLHESDLDEWWRGHDGVSYARVRQDWYEGRHKALDALLGDYLLRREAASRAVTVERLLDEQLPKRLTPIRDDEIRQAYERSLPLPGPMTFEQVKPMITGYLEQQHLEDARGRYISSLRDEAGAVVHLEVPRQPVSGGPGNPAIGSPSASVEMVEFSDFECPFCRQLEPVITRLREKYGDRLRLVWRDFPLPMHSHARSAAEAARCAADQGRFWEYHDVLFANQQALASADLIRYAAATRLDATAFATCLDAGAHRSAIAADLEEGARQGVQATPTVFINGRAIVGAQPLAAYEMAIDEELSR